MLQPPVAPPKQSRKGLWIGLSAGAVALVLICCGALFVFLDPFSDEDPENTGSKTNPTSSAGTKSAPPKKATYKVTAPDTLGSRAKLTDATHSKLATDTETAIKGDSRITSAHVGYYGTADATKDKVYLAAATTSTPLRKAEFEATFNGMAKEAGLAEMTGVTDVDPGPLGGFAKCGNLKIEAIPTAACAWADEGTFVTIMWYNKTLNSQLKAEMITIREAVETKS